MKPFQKSVTRVALLMVITAAFAQFSFAGTRFINGRTMRSASSSGNVYSSWVSPLTSPPTDTTEATPLPIRLMHFTGAYGVQQASVLLVWTAAVQTGVRTYEVESSHDGVKWEALGQVGARMPKAADTSRYAFEDLRFNEGNNYYRLKIIAQNDRYCYSSVVIIQTPQGKEPLNVFPNPARTEVHVRTEGEAQGPSALELLTVSGNAVRKETAIGSSDCTFSVAQVPPGLYLLRVHYADHNVLKKLVVAH